MGILFVRRKTVRMYIVVHKFGRLFVFCSVVVVWTVERFRVWIHNVIPGVFDEFFC
jgi:hypothetical protein